MRILIIHNHYQWPGGEDAVVKAEADLLKERGHEVYVYERSNKELEQFSLWKKFACLFSCQWSRKTYEDITKIIRDFHPDIAHIHNIFFMISPSAYDACQDAKIPVVQSLHNFRWMCVNGLFYRNKNVCQECLKTHLWRGLLYCCYKKSFLLTFVFIKVLRHHWRLKTWLCKINAYITATEFTKKKYIEAGISADKIFVKPNFIYPDISFQPVEKKEYALYVGRLSEEKGVDVLLNAWRSFKEISLKMMGDGPMENTLREIVQKENLSHIEILGRKNDQEYNDYMNGAQFLIVPSRCYESFPRIVVEGLAYGLPIIASRFASLEEIVNDGKEGFLFEPGNPKDLAEKISFLYNNPQIRNQMAQNARKVFQEKYAMERNYQTLMDIYQKAFRLQTS